MSGIIYADLRCLQDPAYQFRGIGQHVAALLRTRRKNKLAHWKTIGLLDPRLGSLPPEYEALLDETSYSVNPCITGEPAVFFDASPMTHDPRFSLRFLSGRFVTAAALYGFIPVDSRIDLPAVADRIGYLGKMARLKKLDRLFPASEHTASRLCELLGVSRRRVHVTGLAVRRSLYELRERLVDPSPSESAHAEGFSRTVGEQPQASHILHEDTVGCRFWSALATAIDTRYSRTIVTARKKPTFAFLSPFPPDQVGSALYTAMTMRAGQNLFQSHVYTDAPRPLRAEAAVRDAGAVSLAPIVDKRNDAVISVIGDDPCHARILEFFECYGGPCILHDCQLAHVYFHRLGRTSFLEFAGKLLGRRVAMEEVTLWLQDRHVPSLFLGAIVDRASPLIVHSVRQQALLKQQYGVHAEVVSGCPIHSFEAGELTDSAKWAVRARCGLGAESFVISTFGRVKRSKGMEACLLALEILRSWHIPAELYFVGDAGAEAPELKRIADLFGITQHVHWFSGFVDNAAYRDFLAGSDVGIQLQIYPLGQFSSGLSDCISAGLPSLANEDLAKSCDAPAYVSIVPNRFSPLQVAEQLALLWETRAPGPAIAGARASYLETHNFTSYAKRLMEILGFR